MAKPSEVPNISEACKIIRKSKQLHTKWYQATYPDVALSEMDPAEHYLKYGAAMGRDPSRNFSTAYYLDNYPEVAEMRVNPLLHYALHGREKGYSGKPRRAMDPVKAASQIIAELRQKLYSLGFTDEPLTQLTEIAQNASSPAAQAMARQELAIWHLRSGESEDFQIALHNIRQAYPNAPDLKFRRQLRVVELLCLHFLDLTHDAEVSFEDAALAGEVNPDVLLAWSNHQPNLQDRCYWINRALAHYDIAPITFLDKPHLTNYDRLTSAWDLPPVTEGPKVTVLLAAYDAATMIPTALRSLQEQTWKNLEILVMDDCSPDDGATCAVVESFAAEDSRIRLIRMGQNAGAYVARNRGLDEATGEFVTIHDADDWSHPQKIETQVRFLLENQDVMGCTSEQARSLENLSFPKIRGNGQFIVFNTSSFLYRRRPVREALGYWDTVRFGADNEFIRRMQVAFGKQSFRKLPTGPLSFQREALSSITTDPVMGLGGAYFGVRKEYYNVHIHHHATEQNIKYTGNLGDRPFPVPAMMQPERKELLAQMRCFDTVVYGDFRHFTPDVNTLLTSLDILIENGKTVALVEAHEYDAVSTKNNDMCSQLRQATSRKNISVLVYGDEVRALEIINLGAPTATSRFMPIVHCP